MSPAPACRSGTACLLSAWALAAGLAFFLDRPVSALTSAGISQDPLAKLAGGAAGAVGDTFFLKADSYYHGGVSEEFGEETDALHERQGPIENAPELAGDWIARVNGKIREHSHYHLTLDKQKEMLPFFSLALKLDPRNVEAVLTTAYWLERQLGKPEEAKKVLERGVLDNPDAWEIRYRLAHLMLRRWKDHAAARDGYEKALEIMSSRTDVEKYMLRNAWYSLGECYEGLGDEARARASYENALHFFTPGDPEGLKRAIFAKLGRAS